MSDVADAGNGHVDRGGGGAPDGRGRQGEPEPLNPKIQILNPKPRLKAPHLPAETMMGALAPLSLFEH